MGLLFNNKIVIYYYYCYYCVDQIFTPKQIGEKAREKKCRVYVGFIDMKKAYDRVNSEALWQVLRMYDVQKNKLRVGMQGLACPPIFCVKVNNVVKYASRLVLI